MGLLSPILPDLELYFKLSGFILRSVLAVDDGGNDPLAPAIAAETDDVKIDLTGHGGAPFYCVGQTRRHL